MLFFFSCKRDICELKFKKNHTCFQGPVSYAQPCYFIVYACIRLYTVVVERVFSEIPENKGRCTGLQTRERLCNGV